MPEGKVISFVEGEYPQIDGLEDGAMVTFQGKATKQGNELVIQSIDLEAEGMADRQLKTMTKQETSYAGSGKASSENF